MYASYCYYVGEYFGTLLSETEFHANASKASDYIDYLTFRKAQKSDDDAVKKCCCALAEQYALINKARVAASATIREDGEIQSETVGSHSRTFRSSSDAAQSITAAEAELANIARRYLLPTGLLYRGGVSGVCSSCCNDL